MQTTPKSYTDIDYESFPIADLTLDRHWIQLPTAVLLERQKARRAAQHAERLAALPEDHNIILVPADPTYSPFEEELWPLINGTIHQTLQPHPDVCAKVVAAVDRALEAHRGWRNPYPASLDTPLPPTRKNN